MNFRTTIFLAVLVLVAIGGWYFVQKAAFEKRVLPKDFGDAKEISIQRHGGEEFVFAAKKADDPEQPTVWEKKAPVSAARATDDSAAINALVKRLNDLAFDHIHGGASTGAQLGLSPPQVIIKLKDDKGKSFELEVGNSTSDQMTYLRVKGQSEVLVVNADPKVLIPSFVGPPGRSASSMLARKLIEKPLGDIRKLEVQRRGESAWTFAKGEAKEGQAATWNMTAPQSFLANSGLLSTLINKIKDAEYDIVHTPGQPGAVSAADAGLEPPQAIVKLVDDKGQEIEVEVGKAASDQNTFVRVKGQPGICVGKFASKDLLKTKAIEYRDLALWNFKADEAVRIEITDRSDSKTPTTYRLVKEKNQWKFEAPVSAPATAKVADMVNALGRLRASAWVDDRADKLAGYGLEPATWTIKATVAEAAKDAANVEADADEAKTAAKKDVEYVLEISDRSPIGEETKAYLRVAGDPMTATIMKATADRLKPVMNEWRDLKVTQANVMATQKIEFVGKDAGVLVQKDGGWTFEADGAKAENGEVTQLLTTIAQLKAVSFAEGESKDEAAYGFTSPQAEMRLTIQGLDQPLRFLAGGYTDPASKLLVYVRGGDAGAVAKVRAADVEKLSRGPRSYLDRTILNLATGTIERVELETENPCGGRETMVLEQSDGEWKMTAPTAAAVRQDRVTKLIDSLRTLRAVGLADAKGTAGTFGLDAPSGAVRISYKPPVEHRIEPDTAASETADGAAKTKSVEFQPPNESYEIKLASQGEKKFAQRSGSANVYEMDVAFVDQVMTEFRSDEVLSFDDAKVSKFSIREGSTTFAFEKRDGKWKYTPEPDLPLDTKKVQNLLLQLKDLKTERYASHSGRDVAKFGLDAATNEVTVTTDDGKSHTLRVSEKSCKDLAVTGQLAVVAGRDGVFVLAPDMIKRFKVDLKSLE